MTPRYWTPSELEALPAGLREQVITEQLLRTHETAARGDQAQALRACAAELNTALYLVSVCGRLRRGEDPNDPSAVYILGRSREARDAIATAARYGVALSFTTTIADATRALSRSLAALSLGLATDCAGGGWTLGSIVTETKQRALDAQRRTAEQARERAIELDVLVSRATSHADGYTFIDSLEDWSAAIASGELDRAPAPRLRVGDCPNARKLARECARFPELPTVTPETDARELVRAVVALYRAADSIATMLEGRCVS